MTERKGSSISTQPNAGAEDADQSSVLAVIDIGSNAIRMMSAQLSPDGNIEVLDRLSQATRLGHDTFRIGRLTGRSMRGASRCMSMKWGLSGSDSSK